MKISIVKDKRGGDFSAHLTMSNEILILETSKCLTICAHPRISQNLFGLFRPPFRPFFSLHRQYGLDTCGLELICTLVFSLYYISLHHHYRKWNYFGKIRRIYLCMCLLKRGRGDVYSHMYRKCYIRLTNIYETKTKSISLNKNNNNNITQMHILSIFN